MSRWAFLFAALIIFATPLAGVAQSSSSPSLLAVCEGDGCSLWEFHGGRATGTFPDGAIANLPIEQFPRSSRELSPSAAPILQEWEMGLPALIQVRARVR